ncbi:MAG: beta-lactamase family protein [Spirochaetaceae bacterium]|jgi:CubicO group peptidase (beta-lactamase class C family)|nr:beta-lactamase family protein [Spirochaetaceae bacterium]
MNFTELKNYIDAIPTVFGVPGCDCSVYFNHKEVFRHSAGVRDSSKGEAVRESDLYRIYSATKVSTCVAALQLVEQGKLKLDEPIQKYLPEYRSPKGTIEDLFTMSAGLNYDRDTLELNALYAKGGAASGTVPVIKAFLKGQKLDFEPHTHYQYSMCHDVLGAIIEIVSGQKFGDYVKEQVTGPLGMQHFDYHLADKDKSDFASIYEYIPATGEFKDLQMKFDAEFTSEYESGGGGGVTTVSDYVLLADALANGDVGANGKCILKEETISLMKKNHLDAARLLDFRRMAKYGYGYGLGVRTLINKAASESPLGEFGWDGAAGAYFLVDTENKLAIFYAQHVLNYGDQFTVIHPNIRDRVYRGMRG